MLPMPLSKFLAVDLGAESGRVFVGILDDGKLLLEEIHRFPNSPLTVSGHLRWDVPALFREIKKAFRLAAEKGHGDIVSVGVDTWGVDFGLVRKDDNCVELPFTYRDSRTVGMMEAVFAKIPRETLYNRTGIQLMQINSVFQLYSMKEDPECNLDAFRSLLFMPDIFNYLLTGRQVSEYTIASTSQLLNAVSKTFDHEIFSTLGIPASLMRELVLPGTIVGRLLPDIASETGLKDVDVVAVGSHDTASAVAAIPAQGVNWAYLSSGTWSLIGIEADKPIINAQALDGGFTNEGGVGGKITFLQNITGLWLLQEVRRKWEADGERYAYGELVEMARTAREFKCVLDPSDGAFLNPLDMPEAIAAFCRKTGQAPETKGEMVRTIFEGLAMRYRAALEKLRTVSGRDIDRLYVVGGGSQNGMLNQFTADAGGIPVIAGPVEAAVVGNIMVQALTSRSIDSLDEARKIIGNSFSSKDYYPGNTRRWDEVYASAPFNY